MTKAPYHRVRGREHPVQVVRLSQGCFHNIKNLIHDLCSRFHALYLSEVVLDTLLDLHSTVPPNTQSSWKRQRPQSEHISDFNFKHACVALPCLMNASRGYAALRADAFVTFRRKRGEKGEVVETVEDVIVRRLTAERIEELKKLIKETQEKHR